jgi:lipopolysaccharide transport system permease protein
MIDSAVHVFASLWRHQELIRQLTRRELTSRYRGSILGVAWSFVTPLLMLGVYTFLFGVVFRARWNAAAHEGNLDYALILFVGLTVYNLFAECVGRAPTLIMANANLVKRVVFPLEILSWSVMGAALVNAGLSLLIWLVAATVAGLTPGWTALWLPVILAPLVLFTMGCTWLLSALGVFVRDVGHAIGVAISMLLFLSPVFYRVEMLPAGLQSVVRLNPLTYFIEEARHALVWHQAPDPAALALAYGGGVLAAAVGLACFQRARRGFADVL